MVCLSCTTSGSGASAYKSNKNTARMQKNSLAIRDVTSTALAQPPSALIDIRVTKHIVGSPKLFSNDGSHILVHMYIIISTSFRAYTCYAPSKACGGA